MKSLQLSYICKNKLYKMKRGLILFAVLAILVSCQEQIKTGFVDNGKMINDYQKKKDIESKFQTKIDAFNKKADSIGRAFQIEAQGFQLKASKMSQKNAQEQYQILGQKQQILQQNLQFEEQQIQKESQTQIDSLIKDVKGFVKNYGEKNGYTYILGSNDAGSVMYGAKENDLTQELLDALNAAYKKE